MFSGCPIKLDFQSAHRCITRQQFSYFVILSNIDRGSSMKVGRTTLLRSAPGLSCDMMCERTVSRQTARFSSHSVYWRSGNVEMQGGELLTIAFLAFNYCNTN